MISGYRNLSNSQTLSTIKLANGSRLITIKTHSVSTTDAARAVELLKSRHGVSHVDVAIANAGIGEYWGPALSTLIDSLNLVFQFNTTDTLILFQAVYGLLEVAKDPKFVILGSPLYSPVLAALRLYPFPTRDMARQRPPLTL